MINAVAFIYYHSNGHGEGWLGIPYVVALYGFYMLINCRERFGSTPYCRDCGYNLTAHDGDRCPECGYEYRSGGVDYGEVEMLWGRFFTGLTMFLVGGGVVVLRYTVFAT